MNFCSFCAFNFNLQKGDASKICDNCRDASECISFFKKKIKKNLKIRKFTLFFVRFTFSKKVAPETLLTLKQKIKIKLFSFLDQQTKYFLVPEEKAQISFFLDFENMSCTPELKKRYIYGQFVKFSEKALSLSKCLQCIKRRTKGCYFCSYGKDIKKKNKNSIFYDLRKYFFGKNFNFFLNSRIDNKTKLVGEGGLFCISFFAAKAQDYARVFKKINSKTKEYRFITHNCSPQKRSFETAEKYKKVEIEFAFSILEQPPTSVNSSCSGFSLEKNRFVYTGFLEKKEKPRSFFLNKSFKYIDKVVFIKEILSFTILNYYA